MIRNAKINRRATTQSGFVALLFALLGGLTACEEPSNNDIVKQQPNATISARTADSEAKPLFIVNGKKLPVSPSKEKPLADLNPNDIQSIDVLKGEQATSLYGEEGKHGVIVVTTKK